MRRVTILLICLLISIPGGALALEVTQVDLPANDILFNSQDGFLYVSVPGSTPGRGNTVTRIDPTTGAIGASLPVGSEPGKLALSDDGTTLYVALGGAAAVRRVDLANFTAGLQFALGSDPFFGTYYAEDIAVQPGNPNVVAISLMYPGVSPRHGGVAVFENGVARPDKTQGHTGSNRIEFSSNPERVYGYNNETTEFGFRRLVVTPGGIGEVEATPGLLGGFNVDIHFDSGRIFSSNGQVIDPESRTLLGTFPFPDFTFSRNVAPDGDRAYFVTGGDASMRLNEFDASSFTPILRQGIAGVSGEARRLVRWGQDGLAFTTGEFFNTPLRVIILRRIHEPPTADLLVTQSDYPDPTPPGQGVSYRVFIQNDGPSPASDVTARIGRSPSAAFQYAFSTRGSCFDSSGTVVCSIGDLSIGDSAVVTVAVVPSELGTLESRAVVSSSTLDPNPSNNVAVETTSVEAPPSADVFVRQVSAPTVATVGQPARFAYRIGNGGPSATSAYGSGSAYGPPTRLESVVSPRGFCGPGLPFFCDFGSLAPGDSFEVHVTWIPEGVGELFTTVTVGGSAGDPDFGNNSLGYQIPVFPSGARLIEDLVLVLWSFELKNGPERGLQDRLQDARDALVRGDSLAACNAMDAFVRRVETRAGRSLTLVQAYLLTQHAGFIVEILGCWSQMAFAGSSGEEYSTVPESGSVVESTIPATLSMAWSPDRKSLELAVPSSGPAKLAVYDVQGREAGVILERRMDAGRLRLDWNGRISGRPLAAGMYFLRLTAGGRSISTRTAVLQ